MARHLFVVLAALVVMLRLQRPRRETPEDAHGRAAERKLSEPGLRAHRQCDRRRGARRHDRDLPGDVRRGAGNAWHFRADHPQGLDAPRAGADGVTIEPRSVGEKRITADQQDLRNGLGVIVAVIGGKNHPITVNISGVTVDANGVDATAGIVYIDAQNAIFYPAGPAVPAS
jgi:hypothetical protein